MELRPISHSKLHHPSNSNKDPDRSKFSDEGPDESRRVHMRSDLDLSPYSQHHTLGPGRNQASPGDHIHDGVTSKKIGPLEMDPNNPGKTRPVWALPSSPTLDDVIDLIKLFVNVR